MNAVFPMDGCRGGIADITHTVFETMLGVSVREVDGAAPGFSAALTAAVYYAGDWRGALLLECSIAQAIDWSSRLMSLPPSPALNDDVKDGLGEVANMLAGNLKSILPPGVALSIPSIVEGTDYCLRICRGNPFERLILEDSGGFFGITFVEVVDEGKTSKPLGSS